MNEAPLASRISASSESGICWPEGVQIGPFEVAAFDAVLHADVPRIILAINERGAARFANIRKLGERNLLARGRADRPLRGRGLRCCTARRCTANYSRDK